MKEEIKMFESVLGNKPALLSETGAPQLTLTPLKNGDLRLYIGSSVKAYTELEPGDRVDVAVLPQHNRLRVLKNDQSTVQVNLGEGGIEIILDGSLHATLAQFIDKALVPVQGTEYVDLAVPNTLSKESKGTVVPEEKVEEAEVVTNNEPERIIEVEPGLLLRPLKLEKTDKGKPLNKYPIIVQPVQEGKNGTHFRARLKTSVMRKARFACGDYVLPKIVGNDLDCLELLKVPKGTKGARKLWGSDGKHTAEELEGRVISANVQIPPIPHSPNPGRVHYSLPAGHARPSPGKLVFRFPKAYLDSQDPQDRVIGNVLEEGQEASEENLVNGQPARRVWKTNTQLPLLP